MAVSRKLLKSGQISWPGQLSRLNTFLLQSRDYSVLPVELPWSRFLLEEVKLLEELVTTWAGPDLRSLAFHNGSIPLLTAMLRRIRTQSGLLSV